MKTIYSLFLVLMIGLLLNSCNRQVKRDTIPLTQYAESPDGMVSTAHPLATKAGLLMLEQGGNAADAAVAAGFALSVVEPAMSGLGGRLQAIVRTPDGQISGIDASTEAPDSYDKATAVDAPYGYPIIGVPGVVAGLLKLHTEHGSLPLEVIIQPAIDYAFNGYNVLPGAAVQFELVKKPLLEFEGTRQYYIKNDSLTYGAGDLLVQQDLGRTLEMIKTGGIDAFYKGEIAEKIAADMSLNGGYVTKASLASYKAKDSEIVTGEYRGFEVISLWLPSFGAITIETLNILAHLPVKEYEENKWASAVYQAARLAYNDRLAQLTHSSGYFTNSSRADSLAALINIEVPDTVLVGELNRSNPALLAMQGHGHTTHLSTADKDGGMVALTQSLGPIMGSKVATPGLGFLYASTLGSYLGPFSPEPGQRAVSHISPTLVLQDGEPFLALGAAGGDRIVTAIVQVISRITDQGMPLDEALAAARVHPLRSGGMLLELHEGIGWHQEDFNFLSQQGLLIEPEERVSRLGRVNAVMFNAKTQTWIGAADPDWEGSAAGPGQ
jgi:gamma-glutamyltranspeptidase/glutathione hydrolase